MLAALRHGVLRTAIAVAFVSAATVLFLEGALRIFFRRQLVDVVSHIEASEASFFEADPSLGWTVTPAASGFFTNGLFRAAVRVDARGIRENAAESTRLPGAPVTLLIGDSNAAGFEVDNDEALSARIEQRLRAAGTPINVLNLGVRRYGTDQAVLRALSMQDLQPRTILYLFTNNDIFDTNVIHRPGRLLGKGTFIRPAGQASFAPFNYPVPEYPRDFGSVALLDERCHPFVHEAMLAPDEPPPLRVSAKRYLWTLRAVSFIRHGPPGGPPQRLEDPTALIDGGWHPELYTTMHEHGVVRRRCADYYEAQMADLLMRLRAMPSVRRVLVALFPDNLVFDDLRAGRTTPSIEMFERLTASGVIDGYVDLGKRFVDADLDWVERVCPADGHLCEEGIDWEAQEIVAAFGAGRLAGH